MVAAGRSGDGSAGSSSQPLLPGGLSPTGPHPGSGGRLWGGPRTCIPSLKLVAKATEIPMGSSRSLCGCSTAVPVQVVWSLRGHAVWSGRPPLSLEPGDMAMWEGWALRGGSGSPCTSGAVEPSRGVAGRGPAETPWPSQGL